MGEIREFHSPNGKEEKKGNFTFRLIRHKLGTIIKILVAAAIVIAIVAVIVTQYKNQLYTNLVVSAKGEKVNFAENSYLGNNGSIITYSKDGISCADGSGKVLWNMTYEMQNPIVRRSEVYVGVGDYNGHVVNVVDSSGNVTSIDTTLPIRDFSICKEGLVAVILEDTTNSWVNLYDVKGTKLGEIKATLSKTGYPLAVAISGEVMAVSYMHVDSDTMKSGVTFYNFGGVGENVTDKIVSSYEYPDAVIPVLNFMDDDTVFAVADNRLMFFEGSKIPKSSKDVLLTENIIGVYYGENQVCLVCYDSSGENKYRVDIYNTKGNKTGSYRYNMDFKDIVVGKKTILIYNEGQCIVVDSKGEQKFNDTLDDRIQFVALLNSDKKYLFVKELSLDTVKFE